MVTGVGGGTVRDLLIGAPVFWVHTDGTLLICIAAGVGVWFLSRRVIASKALLWFDAIGLASYATYGAAKALNYGVAPVPAFAMGVMTACVGGIIRDVLAGEPSILMRPELYVTPPTHCLRTIVALPCSAPPHPRRLVAGSPAFSFAAPPSPAACRFPLTPVTIPFVPSLRRGTCSRLGSTPTARER